MGAHLVDRKIRTDADIARSILEDEITGDLPVAKLWRQLAERHPGSALVQAVTAIERLADSFEPIENQEDRSRLEKRLVEYLEDAETDGEVSAVGVVRAYQANRSSDKHHKAYQELKEKMLYKFAGG